MTYTDDTGPPVIAQQAGQLGHLILNRPAAINALTREMVGILHRALNQWAASGTVRTVLITGAGERGLCAGGDLRAMHADAVSGGTGSVDFWAQEYRLDAAIASYPKPVVAWMDGLVMGGGIGVSGHASLRIVTERSRLAMPEVGIGFHPDVGGSWLLSRAPGEIGTHLGLTGGAFGAADAILAGFADHHVPASRLPQLRQALTERDAAEAIAALATAAAPGELAEARAWIDACYTGDSVTEIVSRLSGHPDPSAQAAAKEIGTKSPTSVAVTLRSLRSAAGATGLPEVLERELHLSTALLRWPDLAEGIRAQIIDKDREPRWRPLDPAFVDGCFPARPGVPATTAHEP